jgi:hypothetical protein
MQLLPKIIWLLVCSGMLSSVYSEPAEDPTSAEATSVRKEGITAVERIRREQAPWLIAMLGKTLSSIGEIVSVRIEREKSAVANPARKIQWSHKDVWNLIENGVMTDYQSVGVALGLPPKFTIEYSNGMKAYCDACTARITLPGGQTGSVVLIPKKPNKMLR